MKSIKRILILIAFFTIVMSITPTTAHAQTSAPSATFVTPSDIQIKEHDKRAEILQKYLESYDSPLAPSAKKMVEEADKNNLDWKLVAAISGVESYYGQQIPPYSYNAWGFGVYGNNVRRFSSWDEGITVVSQSLREDYINKWGAKDIYGIGSMYAASPTWAYKVQHFMSDIDAFQQSTQNTSLSISL